MRHKHVMEPLHGDEGEGAAGADFSPSLTPALTAAGQSLLVSRVDVHRICFDFQKQKQQGTQTKRVEVGRAKPERLFHRIIETGWLGQVRSEYRRTPK